MRGVPRARVGYMDEEVPDQMKSLASLLIALSGAPALGSTYYVSPAGTDAGPGSPAVPWATLQKAASVARAGDTVNIGDGTYTGVLTPVNSGTAVAPIVFRAEHAGLAVLDGGTSAANRDAVFITYTDWIVVDGLSIRHAYRAGVRIDNSNHVTIRRCQCLNSGTWGIFTDYSDDTVLEYNECAYSGVEHGIYASNSGDRPLIRYNLIHDNHASGIQINADPALLEPDLGKRGDGITENAVVEGNIVYGNGTSGGAAINLASVRSSRIVNNLLFNNLAGNITGWDDDDGIQWGSKDNVVVNNTVYVQPGTGRWCVSFKNGSTGNAVVNNILFGGARGSIEIDNDSSVVSDYNVLRTAAGNYAATNEDVGTFWTLAQWLALTGNDAHSITSDPQFFDVSAGNYHLKPGSPALNAGAPRADVPIDLELTSRPVNGKWDVGAFEGAWLPGDANGDEVLTPADAAAILRISGGISASTARQSSMGHLAGAGALLLAGAVRVVRRLAGL